MPYSYASLGTDAFGNQTAREEELELDLIEAEDQVAHLSSIIEDMIGWLDSNAQSLHPKFESGAHKFAIDALNKLQTLMKGNQK